jgi:hypothetical protein
VEIAWVVGVFVAYGVLMRWVVAALRRVHVNVRCVPGRGSASKERRSPLETHCVRAGSFDTPSSKIDLQPEGFERPNAEDRLDDVSDEDGRWRFPSAKAEDGKPGVDLHALAVCQADPGGTKLSDAERARERFRNHRVRRAGVDEHPDGHGLVGRDTDTLIKVRHVPHRSRHSDSRQCPRIDTWSMIQGGRFST